jgi:hypothetical protein
MIVAYQPTKVSFARIGARIGTFQQISILSLNPTIYNS